jgi:hypothetical protein
MTTKTRHESFSFGEIEYECPGLTEYRSKTIHPKDLATLLDLVSDWGAKRGLMFKQIVVYPHTETMFVFEYQAIEGGES